MQYEIEGRLNIKLLVSGWYSRYQIDRIVMIIVTVFGKLRI